MVSELNLKRNVRMSVISFVINIILVFLSYRFVISYDGLESVGLWSLLMAWAGLIRFGDVGMGGAILRFVSPKSQAIEIKAIRMYLDTGLIMNFIVFLILTALGYFIIDIYLDLIVGEEVLSKARSLLSVIFIGIFLASMSGLLISSLQALHVGYLGSYLSVFGNIIQLLGVIVFVPEFGVLGLVWAQLIQHGIILILAWLVLGWNINEKLYFPSEFSIDALRKMFSFSIKAQVSNVTNGFFEPLSKILISQYGGLQVQGVYELAYKTVSLTRNTIVSGVFASLPVLTKLMATDLGKAKEFYLISQAKVNNYIFGALLSVVLVSPVISLLWIGSFNHEFSIYVALIAMGFLINTRGAVAYNLGLATGLMRYNIFSSLLMLLTLSLLSVVLSIYLESAGVVISVSISLALSGWVVKYLNETEIFKDYADGS